MATFNTLGHLFTMSLTCCALFGCGLAVPDIKEVWDADRSADADSPRIPGTAQIEFEIKKHVFCELEKAVKYVNTFPVTESPSPTKLKRVASGPIPLDWIAQVSLSLEVDKSSALNPGLTLSTTLPNAVKTFGVGNTVTTPQSRSLGFGATLSSTATRIDKFDPSWSIKYLMKPDGPGSVCHDENDPFIQKGWIPNSSSPLIIESELGLQDWLFGAMFTDYFIGSEGVSTGGNGKGSGSKGSGANSGGGGTKPDTVSIEIKFVIVSSGNVTPTWKLLRYSANTSGTFFAAGRTRTHDLIITIGPNDQATLYSHLASQIGQAVSAGNGALMLPQQ